MTLLALSTPVLVPDPGEDGDHRQRHQGLVPGPVIETHGGQDHGEARGDELQQWGEQDHGQGDEGEAEGDQEVHHRHGDSHHQVEGGQGEAAGGLAQVGLLVSLPEYAGHRGY